MVGVWGFSPDSFWRMTPQEFWVLMDERKPPEKVGKMDKKTFDELKDMLHAKPRNSDNLSGS